MSYRKVYTKEQRLKIKELLDKNYTFKKISDIVEVTYTGLKSHVYQYGGKLDYYGHLKNINNNRNYYRYEDKLTLDQVEKIREGLKNKSSLTYISTSTGLERNRMRDHIKKYGGPERYYFKARCESKENTFNQIEIQNLNQRVEDLEQNLEIINSFLKERYETNK